MNKDNCKVLSLSLNSILTLVQFLTLKSETLGGYIRLSAKDWSHTLQLDYNKINKNDKEKLLKLYTKIQDVDFPSIIEQLENRFWARLELDKTVLNILGFSNKKIEEYLPKLYKAIIQELKSIKED